MHGSWTGETRASPSWDRHRISRTPDCPPPRRRRRARRTATRDSLCICLPSRGVAMPLMTVTSSHPHTRADGTWHLAPYMAPWQAWQASRPGPRMAPRPECAVPLRIFCLLIRARARCPVRVLTRPLVDGLRASSGVRKKITTAAAVPRQHRHRHTAKQGHSAAISSNQRNQRNQHKRARCPRVAPVLPWCMLCTKYQHILAETIEGSQPINSAWSSWSSGPHSGASAPIASALSTLSAAAPLFLRPATPARRRGAIPSRGPAHIPSAAILGHSQAFPGPLSSPRCQGLCRTPASASAHPREDRRGETTPSWLPRSPLHPSLRLDSAVCKMSPRRADYPRRISEHE
jgi:hypothetical protein